MAKELSVRQLVVLDILVDHGPMTARAVRDHVHDRCPCAYCVPGLARTSCRHCHGYGHVPFTYTDAYRVIRQLEKKGHAERQHNGDDAVRWRPSLPAMIRSIYERRRSGLPS